MLYIWEDALESRDNVKRVCVCGRVEKRTVVEDSVKSRE